MSIKSEKKNGYGFITLDKPEALNALDKSMIEDITKALLKWRYDSDIKAVIFRSSSPKAFSAGGDIKALYKDIDAYHLGQSKLDHSMDYFTVEYRLNELLTRYEKTTISIIDGIVMGGGVGISFPCSYRVMSDVSVFAMPETAIGLYPDVGVVYNFSRLPNHIGLYIGLTGYRMKAQDALFTKFATHLGSSEQLKALNDSLEKGEDYLMLLKAFSTKQETCFLSTYQDEISRIFNYETLLDVENNLSDTEFEQDIRTRFNTYSPLSMAIYFSHYHKAKTRSFAKNIVIDRRLSEACLFHGDLHEGVRALLIDKDNTPHWRHKNIADVDLKEVEKFFNMVAKKGDLTFI